MEKALGITADEIKAKMPHHNISFDLWLTALTLTYLEKQQSSQKELWDLVAQKSRKCLENILGVKEATDILKEACSAI